MRLGILIALDRAEEALQLLPERVAALRAAGRDAQADLEERIGLATFGLNTPETTAALEEEIGASDDLPAWTRGDLAISRAALHLQSGEPDAALDHAEVAARSFAEAEDTRLTNTTTLLAISAMLSKGDLEAGSALLDRLLAQDDLSTGHRAQALQTRARVRGGGSAYVEGAVDADEACRLLAELGATRALGDAHLLAGALWEAIRRGFAKLTRRPDPGPVDLAKLMPITLGVVVVIGAMSALLIYADLVKPVSLF